MNSIKRPRSRHRQIALLTALWMTSIGCGGNAKGPPRVAVEGEVTFRGQPIEAGSILFIPIEDTHGPRAGAVIEAGRYELSKDRGPVVGKLRVEIRAEQELGYDITEPTETVKHIGEPLPQGNIPPEYNDRSILSVETEAEGDNAFNFHLPIKK